MTTHTPSHLAAAECATVPDQADQELLRLGYEPELRRTLGLGSLLVYGLLFFVPLAPVAVYGYVVNASGGVPVLVYLVAAVVMGLSALSYREMAVRFPVAGSVYGYARLGVHPHVGFVAGWLILLDYLLMPALLTVLAAVALSHILSMPAVLVVVVLMAGSVALNLFGIDVTTRVGFWLLAIQLAVIACFIGFVIAGALDAQVHFTWHALARPGMSWAAVASAVSIAALSYLGFDAVSTLNEESTGGGTMVGRATVLLFGLLTVLFCGQLLAASIVTDATSFPPGPDTSRAFYAAVDAVAPAWFSTVFTLTNAFVAIFACLVVAHAATARLLFAMGRDGVLPAALGRTGRRGVPSLAVLVVGATSCIIAVAFASHAALMTSLVTFGALSSYVVLHGCVIYRCVVVERSRRWLTHLFVPVLGAASLVVVLSQTQSLARNVGCAWLALGLIGYALIGRLRRRGRDRVDLSVG